jgi:hypothetical protein
MNIVYIIFFIVLIYLLFFYNYKSNKSNNFDNFDNFDNITLLPDKKNYLASLILNFFKGPKDMINYVSYSDILNNNNNIYINLVMKSTFIKLQQLNNNISYNDIIKEMT